MNKLRIHKYLRLMSALFYGKRAINFIVAIFSYFFHKSKITAMPAVLQIEPTNRCNLKCSLCLTGLGKLKRREGDMALSLFRDIVGQLKNNIIYIVLYNLGEPLLNKDIFKMIEYAKENKIYVKLSTNSYFSNPLAMNNLIKSGLDELIISLDCADADTFMFYKGVDGFDVVKNNIKAIVRERAKKTNPFINLQLLVMKQTENDISKFKKMAYSLGVDRVLTKPIRVNFPGVSINADYLPVNNKYVRKAYKENQEKHKCFRPWISAVFFWDGTVVPCCFDMEGYHDLGNIAKNSFNEIWNSSDYVSFRKKVLHNHNAICNECSLIGILQ